MQVHRPTVAVLAVAVLLAGCAGIGLDPSGDTATPTPTPTANATGDETTGTETPTQTSTPTATPTRTTATPTETWTPPSGPSARTEVKAEPNRFMQVQFVNKREARNGSGYADFDVDVLADTRMRNVDPGPDGTEERTGTGEPYFLVYIDGRLIAQTDVVGQQQYGTYSVDIPRSALTQFDAGTLDVQVVMMDRDSHYDDLYRRWNGTIEYSPE